MEHLLLSIRGTHPQSNVNVFRYWGDDLIAIYNEAYILLAGQKHPTLMGQSYKGMCSARKLAAFS